MNTNKYCAEIESILKTYPLRTSRQNPESYIGGGQSKLRYLGLRVPDLNVAMKNGFSFSKKPSSEISEIWNSIWLRSDCFEVLSLCLQWFYDKKQRNNLIQYWPLLMHWPSKIDNWAHADMLSGIFAHMVEGKINSIYPTLKLWNGSELAWYRRLSIVSLIYYRSQRKKVVPVDKILELVKPLLGDKHYYVQKGVGWTLRETYNAYPSETYTFLKNHITKISTLAFSAATEKLSAKEKESLKKARKAYRATT